MKILAIVLLLASQSYSTSNKPLGFEGIWHSPEMDNMKIKIYQASDDLWYGKIVESDTRGDIGKLMLSKMSYNDLDKSLNGEAQRPDSFFSVHVKLQLKSDDKLKLTVSKFMMGRSYMLVRE